MGKHRFTDLTRDTRGTMGIWMGLAVAAIVGTGAIVVDMGSLYATHGRLQHTADSAALAAVKALPNELTAIAAAQLYAEKNMPATQYGAVVAATDIASGNWDAETRTFTPGATPLNAYRVTARRAEANGNAAPVFFASAFGHSDTDVVASAIAARIDVAPACVTSLSPDAEGAFEVGGTAGVQTYDCNIQVNSCHDSALKAQGNVVVNVADVDDADGLNPEINVCGGAAISGSPTLNPAPNTDTGKRKPDPFGAAEMPDPTLYDEAADCNYTNFSATGDVDLYPGVYCGGITITGSGTATFHNAGGSLANGLYIIKDGPLSIGGTIAAVGNGVTFFLTGGDAHVDFAGTADIGLSAPTTGPYTGFLFIGDPDNPASDPHQMRGTALGGYNGDIYLPGAGVKFVGTANGTAGVTDCTIVVANTVEISGTPNFEARAGCADFGGVPTSHIALVN